MDITVAALIEFLNKVPNKNKVVVKFGTLTGLGVSSSSLTTAFVYDGLNSHGVLYLSNNKAGWSPSIQKRKIQEYIGNSKQLDLYFG